MFAVFQGVRRVSKGMAVAAAIAIVASTITFIAVPDSAQATTFVPTPGIAAPLGGEGSGAIGVRQYGPLGTYVVNDVNATTQPTRIQLEGNINGGSAVIEVNESLGIDRYAMSAYGGMVTPPPGHMATASLDASGLYVVGPNMTRVARYRASSINPPATTGPMSWNETGAWTVPTGSRLIAANGSVTGLNSFSASIVVVNSNGSIYSLANTTSNAALQLGATPTAYGSASTVDMDAIAFDTINNVAYITDKAGGRVIVYNPVTQTYTSLALPSGATPRGISIDPVSKLAYVADPAGDRIFVLDVTTTTPTLSRTISVAAGFAPRLVAVDPVHHYLWLTAESTTDFGVVDLQTSFDTVLYEQMGSVATTLSANWYEGFAYVSSRTSGTQGYIGIGVQFTSSAATFTAPMGQAVTPVQATNIGQNGAYSVSGGSVPPGLSLSSSGALTGTPTQPGTYTFSVQVANMFGSDTQTWSVYVPVPAPTLNAITLPAASIGAAYTTTLTGTWLGAQYAASSNPAPVFAVTSGSLPAGLTLNATTGVISSTSAVGGVVPNNAVTSTFTVTGTNTSGSASRSYTIATVSTPVVIDTAATSFASNNYPVANPTGGFTPWSDLSLNLASGSSTVDEWAVIAGALPSGLDLWGTYQSGTNDWASATQSFALFAPRIYGQVTDPVGTAYDFTLRAKNTVSGAFDTIRFTGVVGASSVFMPSNAPFAVYESVPFAIDLKSRLSTPNPGTMRYQTSQYYNPPLSGTSLNSSTGVWAGTVTGTGLSSSMNVSFVNETGIVNGSHVDPFSVPFEAQNDNDYSLNVIATPTVTASATINAGTSFPNGSVVTPSNGAPTPSSSAPNWAIAPNMVVPSWFTLNANGTFTGTAPASASGSYQFVLTYDDASATSQAVLFTLTINPGFPVTPNTLALSKGEGAAFTASIPNTGGTATACALNSGSTAPNWIVLTQVNGQCELSAATSASTAGQYSFIVETSNLSGAQVSSTLVMLTIQASPTLATFPDLYWAVGSQNSYSFTPTAGGAPMTFTVSSQGAPSWLVAAANGAGTRGTLSGSPTSAGQTNATIGALNSTATTVTSSNSKTVTIHAVDPPVHASFTLPNAPIGVPYSYTVPAPANATVGSQWVYSATNLPPGLSINTSTGVISGTPTVAGSGSVVINVMSQAVYTAQQAGAIVSSSLNVASAPHTLSVTVPAPVVAATSAIQQSHGAALNTTLSNTGGVATGCAVSSSSTLPTGVTLAVSSGSCVVQAGTTVAVGSYAFTVETSNMSGAQVVSTAVTLVNQVPPVIPASQSMFWATGTSSTVPVTPSAGTAPMTFGLTGSSLPNWLSLTSTSGSTTSLTGTPTAAGTTTATLSVNNQVGGTQTQTVTLVALAPPVVSVSQPPTPVVGAAYSYQLPTPTSGTGPWAWSVNNLPSGLSVNQATGLITGTPTSTTTATLQVAILNQSLAAVIGSSPYYSSSLVSLTNFTNFGAVVQAPVYASTATVWVPASGTLAYTPVHTGGSPATSWALANGAVKPSWLSIDPTTGVLSGSAPSAAIDYPAFSVVGSNGVNPDASTAYTVRVGVAPSTPTISAPAPVVGQPYSYTIPAPSTGTAPFTYTLTGTLPAGLTLNPSTGVISGIPTVVSPATTSTGTFTVSVNNAMTTALGTGTATTSSTTLTSSVVTPVVNAISGPVASANLASVSIQPTTTSTTSPAASWAMTISPSTGVGTLSINTTTGAITGAPSAPGSYTLSVTATNAGGTSTAQTVVVNATAVPLIPAGTATTTGANGIPTAVSLTTPSFAFGVAGSYTIASTGSYPTPVTFSSTNLPAWASLSSSGVITGTPPVGTPSPATFTVTAANGVGSGTTIAVSIPLAVTAPTVGATTTIGNVTPSATTTYALAPNQTGGTPATAFVLGTTSGGAGSTAPSWVTINTSTGVISISPQNANPALTNLPQTFTFPVTMTNSANSATTTVSVTVADVPIIPSTLTFAIPTGTAWTHNFANDITSTNGPFTWSIVGSPSNASWLGSTGLFASSSITGVASGTPSADGTTTFTFEVANANGSSQVAVTIIAATPASWANGAIAPTAVTAGVPYSYTFPAPSGTAPFTYTVTGLPSWATFNPSTRTISGTPTTYSGSVVTTPIVISAANALPAVSVNTNLVVTTVAPVAPNPATLSLSATTTAAFSHDFTADLGSGGSPVASWQLTNASPSLAGGLNLATSTGVYSGTALAAGTYTFDAVATNLGGSATITVTLTVTAPPTVSAVSTQLAQTGTAYTYTIPVTGGGSPYTYAVANSSANPLPSWATLNPNGTITGTPPTPAVGPVSVTVNVTNSAGTTPVTFSIGSATAPSWSTTPTFPNAVVGQPYSQAIATPAGTGPFTYAVTSGSLPAGMVIQGGSIVLTGNANSLTAGTSNFTITATNALGQSVAASFNGSIVVVMAAPTYASTTATFATVSQPFSYLFSNAGGSPAATHALTGSYPNAISFSSGTHAGTPVAGDEGAYVGTYTGTNAGGSGTTAYTLTVLGLPVLPSVTTGATATTGTGYTLPITATGTSLGTLTYSVTAGTLPAGLSLNPATGAITGTPTQPNGGTVSFTVTATNQAGYQVGTVVSIPVTVPVVSSGSSGSTGSTTRSVASTSTSGAASTTGASAGTVTGSTSTNASKTTTVPTVNGVVGQSVSVSVPGITGKTVQSFSVTKGSLPQGVTLNPQTGAITGTPSTAGTYTFTVTVIATDGTVENRELTIATSEPAALETQSIDSTNWAAIIGWALGGIALLLLLWLLLALRRRRNEPTA